MNGVIIYGSPNRINSTSGRLAKPFTQGLRDAGWTIEEIVLYDKEIGHCTGCKSCWTSTPEHCTQSDDMTAITELLRSAQLLVIATPLYFFTVPGMVKDFIDRQLALNYGAYQKALGKIPLDTIVWPETCKVVLISPCGFPGLSNFDVLEAMMKKIYGKAFAESLYIPSANPIIRDTDGTKFIELYDTIRKLGHEFGMAGSFSAQSWENFVSITEEMSRANYSRFAALGNR